MKTIFNFTMYICLCEAVTDKDIHAAVEGGAGSVGEVMRCTRAGTRCGSCRTELAEHVAAASQRTCKRRLEMLDPYAMHTAPKAA